MAAFCCMCKTILGSVRVVLADGRPAAYNEYAPFGESETADTTDVFQGQRLAPQYNRFRYNGKEEFPQPGSDLLDYGARLLRSRTLPLERHRPAGR